MWWVSKQKMKSKKARKSTSSSIEWQEAPDIHERLAHLITKTDLGFDVSKIIAFRSHNAKTRAYARIWGLGRIWQLALTIGPSYVIEVISEKFDKLSERQRDEILLHELCHIPKNFSGALMPHKHRGKGNFHDKLKQLIAVYDKHL